MNILWFLATTFHRNSLVGAALIISVVIFGPLFENIHFSIFQQMRMLKILAAVKKNTNFYNLGRPGPGSVILGYQTIWRPLKVVKWTQKWKSMWKSYIVSILDFIVKKNLLVIFWTLCSENYPVLDNFDKNFFWSNQSYSKFN